MSQMFSPFFLSLFTRHCKKRQLQLFLLRNRQQDFFSGKQENAHTALLYPRLATFEASCHRHAGITPDILKERK